MNIFQMQKRHVSSLTLTHTHCMLLVSDTITYPVTTKATTKCKRKIVFDITSWHVSRF